MTDRDRWRAVIDVVAAQPAPTALRWPSRGGMCALCRGRIGENDLEYRVQAGDATITVDERCYTISLRRLVETLPASA